MQNAQKAERSKAVEFPHNTLHDATLDTKGTARDEAILGWMKQRSQCYSMPTDRIQETKEWKSIRTVSGPSMLPSCKNNTNKAHTHTHTHANNNNNNNLEGHCQKWSAGKADSQIMTLIQENKTHRNLFDIHIARSQKISQAVAVMQTTNILYIQKPWYKQWKVEWKPPKLARDNVRQRSLKFLDIVDSRQMTRQKDWRGKQTL